MDRQPVTHGGLPTLQSVSVGSEEKKRLHSKWNTIEAVQEELMQKGFLKMDRPSFEMPPSLTTDDLTTTNSQEYTRLYAEHLAWFNYAAPILASVKARLAEIKSELERLQAKFRQEEKKKNKTRTRDERLSEEDIKDLLLLEPRHEELSLCEQELQQKKYLLETEVEKLSKNMQVISRQVEIRRQEIEGHRIESNMPGRKVPGSWQGR